MKIICIDCPFNYKLWQNEVVAVSSGSTGEAELDLLADEIHGGSTCVVLYSMHFMEFKFGGFMDKVKDSAALLPIGGEAIALGFSKTDTEHIAAVNRYVLYGGDANIIALEKYILAEVLRDNTAGTPEPPREMAFSGIFNFTSGAVYHSLADYLDAAKPQFQPYIAVFIHRYSWVNGNLDTVKALCESLERLGIGAIPAFSSNDEHSPSFAELADKCFSLNGRVFVEALVNLNIYAVMAKDGRSVSEQSVLEFSRLGIPVFAPVTSHYISESDWKNSNNPLTEDMPSSLVMPETYGMTEPVIIGVIGKEGKSAPLPERIEFLARRIASWVRLKTSPNREKKIALMLHNAECSGVEATVGRAFGLDALESAVRVMRRLSGEGYTVEDIPGNGEELLKLIMEKKAFSDFRWTSVEDIVNSGGGIYRMPVSEYGHYYKELPEQSRAHMEQVWGVPPGEGMALDGVLVITGLRFGNVLVMVQPKRGCYGAKCTGEVCKILHDPSCPPPHQYLASYRYLRDVFRADALVEIGTDGSAEYLPGKTSGLSEYCWPSIVVDSLPNLYLYNTGVINEAMVAKRRTNSVIVDYLPGASMGVDEKSAALSRLIDEYSNALQMDNGQAPTLRKEIGRLIKEIPYLENKFDNDDFTSALSEIREMIRRADKARQINLEEHIFGQNPSDEEIRRFVREVWDSESVDASVPLEGPDYDEMERGLLQTTLEMDNLILGLSGSYVPAGESGMPDENGRGIIPTGRNMFGMQIDKVPTRLAWERGVALANQLLDQYTKDEGRLPEQIAMNMISLDATRSGGEQLSQFLYLLGASPTWDKQGRVNGLKVIPIDELKRPRIDVTVRISGVLRDTWPSIVLMMDEAVLMITNLEEPESQNYLVKHAREYLVTLNARPGENRAIRIFGDPPGTYGAGIDLALLASAWKDEDDLAKYFTQSSAFAYGKGLDGARKVCEFIDVAGRVEVSTDITQSRRMNAAACGFGTQVQGGYRLLAKRLSGRVIRQYQSVSERGAAPLTESLAVNQKRAVEDTILNEFWRASVQSKGYDGAATLMHLVQNVFSAQIVNECFDNDLLDRVAEETVNNEELHEWLEKTNPYALEEIGRRLLELESRGKWMPDEKVLERLKQNYLIIEGDMEGRLEPKGDIQGGNVNIINHQGNALWESQLRDIEAEIAKGKSI